MRQYDVEPEENPEIEDVRPRSRFNSRVGVLVGGALAGALGAIGYLVISRDPPAPEPVAAVVETPDDQAVADALTGTDAPDQLPSPADQLRSAQAEVDSLQTELDARDAELARVKAELARRDEVDEVARSKARERQAAIQHQIDGLKAALADARAERDQLRDELKTALAEVDRQVKRNARLEATAVTFKAASAENLWFAFTNNAKVRICDRGTYKRRQSCESDLTAWFDAAQHDAFTSCVSTRQAIPVLWKADSEIVPPHAQHIDARDRERGDDWFVVYCDPTLPEVAENHDITDEMAPVFAVASR